MRKIESWVLEAFLRTCDDPKYTTVVAYEPGGVIFSVGDPGDYMAVVLSGQVDIRQNGKMLTTMDSGAVFGEMGLIDGVPRSADAVARSHCRVARIREGEFAAMLEKTPHFALSMMRLLTDRLRTSTTT